MLQDDRHSLRYYLRNCKFSFAFYDCNSSPNSYSFEINCSRHAFEREKGNGESTTYHMQTHVIHSMPTYLCFVFFLPFFLFLFVSLLLLLLVFLFIHFLWLQDLVDYTYKLWFYEALRRCLNTNVCWTQHKYIYQACANRHHDLNRDSERDTHTHTEREREKENRRRNNKKSKHYENCEKNKI